MELNVVYNEDCLEGMNRIEAKSVDMILCDLPYGTTACKWDTIIPFEPLWKQYNRVIKDNGAICLFGNEPFSSYLRMSNIKNYKYDWYWDKVNPGNPLTAKYHPQKIIEQIIVFSKNNNRINYYPIMEKILECDKRPPNIFKRKDDGSQGIRSGVFFHHEGYGEFKYPKNKLTYNNKINELNSKYRLHPTQKPIKLCEYLIKTYTNEGDIVLDNCMGSGTTAIACMNTNRNYIGFELDKGYYDIILERIKNHKPDVIQESKQGLETWF